MPLYKRRASNSTTRLLSLGLLLLSLAIAVAMLGTGAPTEAARPGTAWLPAASVAAHAEQTRLAAGAVVGRLAHEARRWRVLMAHRLGLPLPAADPSARDADEAASAVQSVQHDRAAAAGATPPLEEPSAALVALPPARVSNTQGAAVLGSMLWGIHRGDSWLAGLQQHAAGLVPATARQTAAHAARGLERSAALTRASMTSAWHAAEPYGARVLQAVHMPLGFSPLRREGGEDADDGAGMFLACIGAGFGAIVALAAFASATRQPLRKSAPTRSLSRSQQVRVRVLRRILQCHVFSMAVLSMWLQLRLACPGQSGHERTRITCCFRLCVGAG